MAAPPAIEVDALRFSYRQRPVLTGLSFQVQPGTVFGLLGPNGAGKTTLSRLLTGQLAPESGRVRVLGLDPDRDGAALRRRIGVVLEEPGHYDRLSVRRNLRFFAALHGAGRDRVEQLLGEVGLAERGSDPVSALSRGMRQRLALARAMVGSPQVLFLDEPTSGLDIHAARRVRALIRGFCSQGGTVFLTTHDLDEADDLCAAVGILASGRLTIVGGGEGGGPAEGLSPWGGWEGLELRFLEITGRNPGECVEAGPSRQG